MKCCQRRTLISKAYKIPCRPSVRTKKSGWNTKPGKRQSGIKTRSYWKQKNVDGLPVKKLVLKRAKKKRKKALLRI